MRLRLLRQDGNDVPRGQVCQDGRSGPLLTHSVFEYDFSRTRSCRSREDFHGVGSSSQSAWGQVIAQ